MPTNTTNTLLVLSALVFVVAALDVRKGADKAQTRGEEYWSNSHYRGEMAAIASEFEWGVRVGRSELVIKKRDQLLEKINYDLRIRKTNDRVVVVQPHWTYHYWFGGAGWVETPDPIIYIYER